MTGDRSRLMNFLKKFTKTVRFGNDHFGAIIGYGDYVIGDSVISRVYYVEGLGYNHFSVGQFCDSDLEVAFRKHSCFVRDVNGVELIKSTRDTNLYTISVEDMMRSSHICLLSKASKNKSWLWHRRLNHLNFGLIPKPVPAAPYVPPTNKELEILFQPMFDEYFVPPTVKRPVSPAPAVRDPVISDGSPLSLTIDQDAPSISHSPSSSEVQPPFSHQGVAAGPTIDDNPFALVVNDPFENIFALELSFAKSSSGDVSATDSNQVSQPYEHLRKWSKDHPMENIIGNPSHLVSTCKQLATDALWCLYNSVLSKVKPKNFKDAVNKDCWFEAMQEEIHEFDRLQVWELVTRPDCVMIIALKWIYKVKLDEYGDVLKNKARLVAKGY
ncbi:retrovirus-related pol polyprotein from transposon TNT 1-94 [Tanacetum coccineum]